MFGFSWPLRSKKVAPVMPDPNPTNTLPSEKKTQTPRTPPKTPPWVFMTRTSRKQHVDPPSIFEVPSKFDVRINFPTPQADDGELTFLEDFDTFFSDYGFDISYSDMVDMIELCAKRDIEKKLSKARSMVTVREEAEGPYYSAEEDIPPKTGEVTKGVYYPKRWPRGEHHAKDRSRKKKKKVQNSRRSTNQKNLRIEIQREPELSSMPEASSTSDDEEPKSPLSPILRVASNFFQF